MKKKRSAWGNEEREKEMGRKEITREEKLKEMDRRRLVWGKRRRREEGWTGNWQGEEKDGR